LRAGREFETNAVRQFLALEVGRVGGFEVGEVEFLAGAGGVVLGLLGGGRGEVQVAGVVEGEPAAFPELWGWRLACGMMERVGGGTY
jgi:hypothetical protein